MKYVISFVDRFFRFIHYSRNIILFWVKQIKSSRRKRLIESKKSINVQNSYDLKKLKSADKLILFLIPPHGKITGGIISIYNLLKLSREVKPNYVVSLVTYPGFLTLANYQDYDFYEKIFRWEQIVQNCINLQELIIHIPEYYAPNFYKDLRRSEIKFLKSITLLRINILNQNILLMPKRKKIQILFKITNNITQSVGFDRNVTQQVCDKYGIPLYAIPSFIDLEKCVKKEFSQKRKLILYSLDFHPLKKLIVKKLRSQLVDFEVKEIRDLSYFQFLDLISSALFCISFGEGFDGYYIQPYYAQSIGISVYNETFFPNAELTKYPFLYASYSDLSNRIVSDIKKYTENPMEYIKLSHLILNYFKLNINKRSNTKRGLEMFYKKRPTFVPKVSLQKSNLY